MAFELDLEKTIEIVLANTTRGDVDIPELVKALVEQGEIDTGESEDLLYDAILVETDTNALACVVDTRTELQDEIDAKATEIAELEEKLESK